MIGCAVFPFPGETSSKKQKKYLTPEKHSPNIHLTAEEAHMASSFKSGQGQVG
jgi:hypothetical protein